MKTWHGGYVFIWDESISMKLLLWDVVFLLLKFVRIQTNSDEEPVFVYSENGIL